MSISTGAGGFFSTGGTAIGRAVIKWQEAVHPVTIGEASSPGALTVDSRTIAEVGLCHIMPWVRFNSLLLISVGERMSFLELVGVVDWTAGGGSTETRDELFHGELVRDLMSMKRNRDT